MVDILDPASGPYILDSTVGPATAVYTPNTSADYTGDGDVDDYAIYRVPPALSILDSNATAPVDFLFSFNIKSGDPNARGYLCSFVNGVTHGAKNAIWGCYFEVRDLAPNVEFRFGTIQDGTKISFSNCLYNTQYWATLTYDPTARTIRVSIYTDSARTNLLVTSPALDTSAGPDDAAGGAGVFQPLSMAPRGKGAAPYEYWVGELDFGGGGASILITGSTSGSSALSGATDLNLGVGGTSAALGSVSGSSDLSVGFNGNTVGVSDLSAGLNRSLALTASTAGIFILSGTSILDKSLGGICAAYSTASGETGLSMPLSGMASGGSSAVATAWMTTAVSGVTTNLSGLSGALTSQGIQFSSGVLNAVSGVTGLLGLALGFSSSSAGLSTLTGSMNRTMGAAGSATAMGSVGGFFNTELSAEGGVAALGSIGAGVYISRDIVGTLSGLSFLTADITTQALSNLSGEVNALSDYAGGVAMGYSLVGTAPSTMLLTGHIHEVLSSGGLISGNSSVTGSTVLIGQLSPASRAGSPRFDITRYGGGTVPLVQVGSGKTTVIQDNNNAKVTR